MRVFLMGGTGLVGSRLINRLCQRKDEVVLLTRRPDVARARWTGCTVIEGNPMQTGPWMKAVDTCDAIVNLVGEGIFSRRWNAEFITLLRTSRVQSTENAVKALAVKPRTAQGQPKVLVNASAIGFYGPHGDEPLTEDSPAGNDLMAEICVAWEIAAKGAEAFGIRTTRIRIGVVLDKEGGALKQMMLPFKMFVGGPVGFTGSQYMSWIHHEDLVALLLLALDNPACQGVLNGTVRCRILSLNKHFPPRRLASAAAPPKLFADAENLDAAPGNGQSRRRGDDRSARAAQESAELGTPVQVPGCRSRPGQRAGQFREKSLTTESPRTQW